jgi:tRNA (guanine37-N1)-methyltransferase
MRIDIITAVPELLQSPFEYSIVKRAKDKGFVEIFVHNLRDFALNKYGQIDDYQFGGGAGMVMMIEPIDTCISGLLAQRPYDEIIYVTPDAPVLNQKTANNLSLKENIIMSYRTL